MNKCIVLENHIFIFLERYVFNCFRDSIIQHPTCFVNKGKVNSRNFTYDGPTFSTERSEVVKDEMSSHL
jgi:hypothetical protein